MTYAYIYMDPVEGDELQGGWVQCMWYLKYCLIVHKCTVEWAGRRRAMSNEDRGTVNSCRRKG